MSTKKHVVAVDDDPRYLRLLRVNLEPAGYTFTGVADPQQALDLLAGTPVDLVLLDVRMAQLDGFALLEQLREFSDVPVIIVSALGEEGDRVRGLKLGADDYLTKPFGAAELLARVEAVLRRYNGTPGEAQVTIGAIRLDPAQRRVFRGEQELTLTRTEYRLLACLVRHLGKVVPQDQLVREVWGAPYEEDYEGLRVYVYRLRQKLERTPDHPELLTTFPGVGYILHPPRAGAAGAA